ncbi:transposase, partial [uncultured Microscilla sp.]|uniref:transposase n=1 Tax=uncultured Microscilla sp. TaxID=432653 RepID=UPI0026386140
MNHINKLIWLYCFISESYNSTLHWECQRTSNNYQPKFTDVEVLTVYLYGILEENKHEIKDIHRHTQKHLLSWFPLLPGYANFNRRLNRLTSVLPLLTSLVLDCYWSADVEWDVSLGDAMPIVLAKAPRSGQAKVAPEICNKGYCASKSMYYYGVKLHTLAFRRPGKLPVPEYMDISPAASNDLTAMKPVLMELTDRNIFLDKAYCHQKMAEELAEVDLNIFTPVKKKKGQQRLDAVDNLFSTAVSRVRQPIEG